jgi:hypothetical protein
MARNAENVEIPKNYSGPRFTRPRHMEFILTKIQNRVGFGAAHL